MWLHFMNSYKINMTLKIFCFEITFFLAAGLFSCDASTKPYIEHEVTYKKIADDCARASDQFKMTSNTNGERYILQQCLDADFDKTKMNVERKGDTVVIGFKSTLQQKSLLELTIDIDTYPRYNFLTINENTFSIIPAAN